MKNIISIITVLITLFISQTIYSQEYFIADEGKYFNSNNFKTNIQENLSNYKGCYIAGSESYESNYSFIVSVQGNELEIVFIYGGSDEGGDNWSYDSTFHKGIKVNEGKFTISDIPDNFGNNNFRFVKATYSHDGINVKEDGLVMEDYTLYAYKKK